MTAVILARPDEARGKPSSLLKDDDRYKSTFNADISLQTYAFVARALKSVTAVLASDVAGVSSVQRLYLRFHVMSAVVALRLGYWPEGVGRLAPLVKSAWVPTSREVKLALFAVLGVMSDYANDTGSTMEKATKASGLNARLKEYPWDQVDVVEV
jgi:hypothetical protein